jgi:tripartite-type tricarboxylate transporter receptor subunit TctC
MVAPAGTPRPMVDRLNAEIRRALADPEAARKLRAQGNEPAPSSPEELRALIAADRERMGRVVREAGISLD